MLGLDLNAPSTEDFGMKAMEPQFCTQAAAQEMVGKSPKPNIHDQGAVVGGYDEQWQGARHHRPPHTTVNQSNPRTTLHIKSTTYPNLKERVPDEAGMNEEVASSTHESFIGMRFDTVKSERAHYNAYAEKNGFSIKSHTSKKKSS
jgi:hypothetical protein